jgi:hypothetical protein
LSRKGVQHSTHFSPFFTVFHIFSIFQNFRKFWGFLFLISVVFNWYFALGQAAFFLYIVCI